ncbi:MAG: hypothetical protein ACON3Z_05935 [Bradymonadia bacterium]
MFRFVICIALIAHGGLSVIAFRDHGYAGYFPPFADTNTTQIFSDLVLALVLVNVWVYFDLKRRNQSVFWFFLHLLGTALAGSFAPLIYCLIRGGHSSLKHTDAQS